MISPGDILICIYNIPTIFEYNKILPIGKSLHVKFTSCNDSIFEFIEYNGEIYTNKLHTFITLLEYRKIKLNKLNESYN